MQRKIGLLAASNLFVGKTMLPPIKGGQETYRKVERITINGEIVLTTEQLANFYETDAKIISNNYNRNQERFIEGQQYFKLEGDDL